MGALIADLRSAVRHLRQSPGFALAAIGTLALGIGATTAIFSTVNAALLRPLPYPNPGELYGLRTTLTDGRVTTGLLSPVEIGRLNDPKMPIARAAGLLQQDVTLLRNDGTPVRTVAYGVTEGFFDLFGLPMTIGPGLTPEQFTSNGPPQVVISNRIWRDMFGSDPAVVGKPLRFAELNTTVIGVAPRDFDTPHGADFWFGLRNDPRGVNHSFEGFMRVKPGANIDRVREEMAAVMDGVAREFPLSSASRIYIVRPLVEQIVGDLGSILIVVLSATALLLVLACVNVTNLLLARGTSRLREIAVRVALGASRGRVLRQLLTESAVLATAGALAGLALAYAGVRLMLAAGASRLPRLDAVSFDTPVLLFALFTTAVCGLVVGLAPALRLAGADLRTLMNESSRSASGGHATARWLGGLMIAEIALAVVLVAGAGWLVRGFDNLRSVDLGFAPEGRLTFDASFQGPKYPNNESVDGAVQDLLRRLRALPGVTAAATTANLPLAQSQENSLFLELRGEPMDPKNPLGTRQRLVGPGFFGTMDIKLASGRDFNDSDRLGSQQVAIVNETFVRKYLTGRDPLGVRFSSGYPTINPQSEAIIIGVVADVRQRSVSAPGEPAFYSSDRQLPFRRRTFVVATRGPDTSTLQSSIRTEVRTTDPLIAVQIDSLPDLVASTWERQQLGMTLMLVFGVVALLLAAVGIYGVIAYATSQRRTEVATRLALGASPGDVFRLILRQGRALALVGSAIGLGLAYLSGRVVANRLYEVSAADPWILGLATVLMAAIAALATAIPAFRASRIDPVEVLRPRS